MLKEDRLFNPPKEFRAAAHVKSLDDYEKIYAHAKKDPEAFWAKHATEMLHWHKPFTKVLEWDEPFATWFSDGMLNASFNCLDKHLTTRGSKPAIIWEGEPGDKRVLTYADLHKEVCQLANGLKNLGLKKGDVATIYMPMIPELAISLLACSRLGVTHNVIFGGFSADSIADRNNDAKAKVVITADGGWRRGQIVPLKENVDAALPRSETVKHVIVFKRTGNPVQMQDGRDIWWHELLKGVASDCPAEPLPAEHPLFLLYTSGSTGKPKGILHTTGGYLLQTSLTFKYVFDWKEEDIYWCTADIGWVTGHSYIVYGPLINGATTVMYEGAPNFPDFGRFWDMIDRYKVSIFYTAPTAIRAFMKAGDALPLARDLSSLRLLGTVGEPINPEAWMWYRGVIGKERCPIVDTWWQTETGGIMVAPLPGAVPTKPGTATLPFFGIEADVVDKEGNSVPTNAGGYLVVRRPWPSMLRTIHGDPERYKSAYWSQVKGMYFTGDGARRDENGFIWIMGRIDDVLNVSGHRLSTMEIESALVAHPAVAEAAVVGMPHDLKGEGVFCFVSLHAGMAASEQMKNDLKAHVAHAIGAIARPDEVRFADALPKTRSGKIMRRLLRDIAAGRESKQDTTTLEDHSSLDKLREED